MPYENFDLWIDAADGGRYRLRAGSSLTGEAFAEWAQFDPALNDIRTRANEDDIDRAVVDSMGRALYDRLFAGDLREALSECIGQAARGGLEGVCIRLRIRPPEAGAVPWEFTAHPRRGMFGATPELPLVRYLEVAQPIRGLTATLPLRMLVAVPDSPGLRTADEIAQVREALGGLVAEGVIALEVVDRDVTFDRLGAALARAPCDIFHFIGHGHFLGHEGTLRLDATGGGVHDVSDEEFVALFARPPKLVFLNACEGATGSSRDAMLGLAPRLVAAGVPAVIAMQYEIRDAPAVEFSQAFYQALAAGPARGRVDAAMCEARRRLAARFPGQRDIGAPVLFLRAEDGVLFDLDSARAWTNPLALQDTGLDRGRAYARAHRRNLERLEAARATAGAAEQDIDAEIAAERTALARLTRHRNRSLVLAIGLVLTVFVAGYLQLFDLVQLDTRVRQWTMQAGAPFLAPPAVPPVVIIAVGERTFDLVGRRNLDRSWRPLHARLVDRAVEAGAKVIALDFAFGTDGDHEALVDALRRARSAGVAVVAATLQFDGSVPRIAPALREVLTAVGVTCLGTRLGFATTVPVAFARGGPGPTTQPSFASLAAYLHRVPRADIARFDPALQRIGASLVDGDGVALRGYGMDAAGFAVSETREVEEAPPGCPAIRSGDVLHEWLIDPAVRSPANRTRMSFEAITLTTDPVDSAAFRDAIVVVGEDRAANRVPVPGHAPIAEFEIKADAIAAMTASRVVRPQGEAGQLAGIVLCALAGIAAVRWRPAGVRHWGSVSTAIAAIAALAGAITAYVALGLLINALYYIAAFTLAYWSFAKLRRGWIRRSP